MWLRWEGSRLWVRWEGSRLMGRREMSRLLWSRNVSRRLGGSLGVWKRVLVHGVTAIAGSLRWRLCVLALRGVRRLGTDVGEGDCARLNGRWWRGVLWLNLWGGW